MPYGPCILCGQRNYTGPCILCGKRNMPTVFPACMMPDGAEPCEAFQKLQAENERLRAEVTRLTELFAMKWDATQSAESEAIRREFDRVTVEQLAKALPYGCFWEESRKTAQEIIDYLGFLYRERA